MKKKRKLEPDPRLETPPGHYLRHADWLPEKSSATSFFSVRDLMLFGFLVISCVIVGAILWFRPPKYISFDTNLEKRFDPAVAAKNIPKQLRKYPGYDTKRFEEIPDDDPAITGDESDLPLKETPSRSLPSTIKSEIKKVLNLILASLRFRNLV